MKLFVALAFAACLAGCAHGGPTYTSMSTGAGQIDPRCGKYKDTDVRCNPAMSAAGGN